MENEKHEKNSVFIPLDLMIDIFRRLPSKSIMKFKCLSKQYLSLIQSRNLVDSFFSYSSKKPRLLIAYTTANELELCSATTTTCSSTVANHVMTVPGNWLQIRAPPVRGLICYSVKPNQHVICNPTTRQLLPLPQNQHWTETYCLEYLLFGYEPISNRFKIISIVVNWNHELQFWIFTVGDGNSWRKIQDVPYHNRPVRGNRGHGICINGVLYYLTYKKSLVSFDLNSEKFRLIELPPGYWCWSKLIDFQGKLAFVESFKHIRVCVLEDAEKHKWSSKLYNLPSSLKYSRWFYHEDTDALVFVRERLFLYQG